MAIVNCLSKELSGDDLVEIFNYVGENGDILIVKNDGMRKGNNYTVIMTISDHPADSFRCDNGSLSTALQFVLHKYLLKKGVVPE